MKKRLLNEETTRRFMKLANLGGLSETFVTETEKELEETYTEEEDPEMGLDDEELPAEEPEMDLGMDDELPAEEPEMEMGAEAPAGDLDASAVINAVAQATLDALKGQGLVSDETTVAVDDAGGEAPMPEPEMEMEPEMEVGDEEPALDEPGLEDEEEMMEQTDALEEESVEETTDASTNLEEDDAFVSEIVRRVAERILAANKIKS
jgi:hypothetical protein